MNKLLVGLVLNLVLITYRNFRKATKIADYKDLGLHVHTLIHVLFRITCTYT